MLEYLAQKFGPEHGPKPSNESELRETGAHLSQNAAASNNMNKTALTPSLDESSSTALRSRTPVELSNCKPSDSKGDARQVQFSQDIAGLPVSSGEGSLRRSMEQMPKYLKGPTLSDVRNELDPQRGCNSCVFPRDTTTFTSDTKIWEYMTEARVRTLLAQCELGIDESAMDELARKICGMPTSKRDTKFISYRKIFTILILLEKQSEIASFVNEQLHDSLLPLPKVEDADNPHRPRLQDSNICHPCFKNWEKPKLRVFGRYQMEMCAPFFKYNEGGKKYHHYKFPEDIALPFLNAGTTAELGSGASADVIPVELPEAHGNLRTFRREVKHVS